MYNTTTIRAIRLSPSTPILCSRICLLLPVRRYFLTKLSGAFFPRKKPLIFPPSTAISLLFPNPYSPEITRRVYLLLHFPNSFIFLSPLNDWVSSTHPHETRRTNIRRLTKASFFFSPSPPFPSERDRAEWSTRRTPPGPSRYPRPPRWG